MRNRSKPKGFRWRHPGVLLWMVVPVVIAVQFTIFEQEGRGRLTDQNAFFGFVLLLLCSESRRYRVPSSRSAFDSMPAVRIHPGLCWLAFFAWLLNGYGLLNGWYFV